MRPIFILAAFIVCSGFTFTQTRYFMIINQGTGKSAFNTSTVDSITFIYCPSMVEHGGEQYPAVLVGEKCWLAKNLNIGSRIDGTTEQTNNATIEKYCYNDLESNCTTYGGLYQWDEAMQYLTTEGGQGLCPTGWHLPSNAEYVALAAAVDNNSLELKDVSVGGTNSSGFSALMPGLRFITGSYTNLNVDFTAWSSSQNESGGIGINIKKTDISNRITFPAGISKSFGFSLRCVMD